MAKEDEEKRFGMKVTFRVLQAISWGVCVLGISMGMGDYIGFIESPIRPISVTLALFGFAGALITGYQAKNCDQW